MKISLVRLAFKPISPWHCGTGTQNLGFGYQFLCTKNEILIFRNYLTFACSRLHHNIFIAIIAFLLHFSYLKNSKNEKSINFFRNHLTCLLEITSQHCLNGSNIKSMMKPFFLVMKVSNFPRISRRPA